MTQPNALTPSVARRSRALRWLAPVPLILLLAATACSDDPDPPRADEVRVAPTSATLDRVGATVQLLVTATDQYGAPFEGVTPTWSSNASNVATVDASGVVTAVANGTAEIRATIGEASGSAQITVAQVATAVEVVSGNGQTGIAGDPLPNPIRARAVDAGGTAVPGAALQFQVSTGGGTLGSASATAGADGIASTTWTLGPVAGAAQGVSAGLASGSGTPVAFSASAIAGPAASVEVTAGDAQTGPVLTALPSLIEVLVADRLGNPTTGATVAFTVATGGGSVSPSSTQTNSQGRAATAWTLGSAVGTQTLGIASGSGSAEASATATLAPGAMVAFAGTGQSATVGTSVATAPAVRVTTTSGVPVPGIAVAFAVTAGEGSITDADGDTGASALITTDANGVAALGDWELGTTAGSGNNTVTASLTGLDDVVFTASANPGAPTTLTLVAGGGQSAEIGTLLPGAITVALADEFGNDVPGVAVSFSVTQGSVSPESDTTDGSGEATTSWTLGSSVGTQFLTVSANGVSDLSVSAVAEPITTPGGCILDPVQAGFQIQICFVTSVSNDVRAVFTDAAARWEGLITGDLPNLSIPSFPEGSCGDGSPAITGTLDDLVIFAWVEPIDGPFGTLGAAGPCATRFAEDGGLTAVGVMYFDDADLDVLLGDGELDEVILHEMGHVLGFGTLWGPGDFDLIVNPTNGTANPALDTHFSGPLAIAAFDAAGGTARTVGAKVPVENTQGGSGTLDGHWRESTMVNELMTGFLDSGVANPLSAISIQSLADMGYVVDPSGSDAYSVVAPNSAPPLQPRRVIGFGDDILRIPVRVLDRNGQVIGVVERR